jgi:hypothetical protein
VGSNGWQGNYGSRWDHTIGEFVPLHFTEIMIDHLEIDSVIHHIESEEAKAQIRMYGMPPPEDGQYTV